MNNIFDRKSGKTLMVLLGFPRTGSKALISSCTRGRKLLMGAGCLVHQDQTSGLRARDLVPSVLFTSPTEDHDAQTSEILVQFRLSPARILIVSDEAASILVETPSQLEIAANRLQNGFGIDLHIVCYVRSPMTRYPSWVLHHASRHGNSGTSNAVVREARIRRTLHALQWSGVQYTLRMYREDDFDITSDFMSHVLRIKSSLSVQRDDSLLRSPEFVVAARSLMDCFPGPAIDIEQLAQSLPHSAVKRAVGPRRLKQDCASELRFQTFKLNYVLAQMADFSFGDANGDYVPTKHRYQELVGVEDCFEIDDSKVLWFESQIREHWLPRQ